MELELCIWCACIVRFLRTCLPTYLHLKSTYTLEGRSGCTEKQAMNKLLCFTEVEKYYVTHYKRLNIYQIHMHKSFLFTLQLGTIYRHRTLSYHYYCVFSGFLYCLLYSLLHLFYVLIFSLFVTVLLSTCLIEMYRKKKNVLY